MCYAGPRSQAAGRCGIGTGGVPAAPRVGTPGVDVFKIAGASISGWYPSYKAAAGGVARQPYTTQLECFLGFYLEYHPWVSTYQRGDMSPVFAQAHHLATPLGTPYGIDYAVDGVAHTYLPDYVGVLTDGGLVIAEAGLAVEKAKDRPQAKAAATRQWVALQGGVYWLGTEDALVRQRHWNWLFLHARRQGFPTFGEIAATLLPIWHGGARISVAELVEQFGRYWSATEVEATAWKIAGDAAAAGHLLADLEQLVLTRTTPLMLLDPAAPPILPAPLPQSLPARVPPRARQDGAALAQDEEPLPGPTVDADAIASIADRHRFLRNLRAVLAVIGGESLRSAGSHHGMSASNLAYLVKRARSKGQLALVPYRTYVREAPLRPEFAALIKTLYTRRLRPTVMAVSEDVELQRLATELTGQESQAVVAPSYWQVYRYLASVKHTADVAAARSGLAHPPPDRESTRSYVLSIPAPALVCQVDEHYMDVTIVTPQGVVMGRRAHAGVLICVKTAAILGAVLSLDTLTEDDYMRLVKQAIEPKDAVVALYRCVQDWPCHGKPALILHDRGAIFTSTRATQVLVDRLGITTSRAPAFAPTAKGTVEALFTWVTRKLTHRLPGTTKESPQARGAYDSVSAARTAGITFDVLEELFTASIVDGYMREWDHLRGQTRSTLWDDAVRTYGVPHWLGTADDLILLFKKSVNRRNRATGHYAIDPSHGISFKGRWYVSPGLLPRLRGQELDLYYDRRDIRVLYLFVEGVHVGEAYCTELMGRGRVSIWEAAAERHAAAPLARAATAESRSNRQALQEQAARGRPAQRRETRRLERARQLDLQQPDMHPAPVQAVLRALEETGRPQKHSRAVPPVEGLAPAVPDDTIIPLRRPAIRPQGAMHD